MGSALSSESQSTGSNLSQSHGRVHLVKDRSDFVSKLSEAEASGKVVVVDFTASWCGPCKFIAPIFAQLSEQYPNVIFLKVDVDELSEISQEMDIHAMPTFVFIHGKNKEKLVGANKAELEKKVKYYAAL